MQLRHLVILLFLTSCVSLFAPLAAPVQKRPVQYLPGSSFESCIQNGLTNEQRKAYYSMDEGVQWLPIDVLMSLKRPDASGLRVMDELLLARPERFGLLPNYVNPQSDIPLGITSSTDTDYASMAGINCSTCHTSMISNTKGQFFLVDGASSRFAVDRFIGEMVKALVATLVNPVEFEAFFERYRARIVAEEVSEDTSSHRTQLASLVQKSYTTTDVKELNVKLNSLPQIETKKITTLSSAYPTVKQLSTKLGMYVYLARRFIFFFSQVKYGTPVAGSLVAESGLGRSNPWSVAKKMMADKYLHSSNMPHVEGGPVNTPYNWDYDRQKWIFWDGVTNSMLERNMAQGVTLVTDFNETTSETTISIKKLDAVLHYTSMPRAPHWPERILGRIDTALAEQGKPLFRMLCLNCHDPKYEQKDTGSVAYNYTDVGTDDSYYQGQIEPVDGKNLFTQMIAPFIGKVKTTAATNEGLIPVIDLPKYETGRLPVMWRMPTSNAPAAKPLAGIWATPPYLHNGSVPTIWDLLQPTSMRPIKFHIGGFVYDSKKLGYVEDTTLPDGFDVVVSCSTGCQGNSNAGHEFGTDLSEDAKLALIEFIKSYAPDTSF